MTKSVAITPQIQSWLNAAAGTEIDPSTIAVFECVATNSRPIRKKGSLFENAEISRSTMDAMAASVNGGESVPLHTLHRAGDQLPVGKVFRGEVKTGTDGAVELHTLFYVPRDTQASAVADIEKAVIDEVSVGIQAKSGLCSECGFDYFADGVSSMHLYDRTCANDHIIGANGVHLNLIGLTRWYELSLVGKGAAPQAKILSRAKQAMSAAEREKLAASGHVPEASILIASTATPKDSTMSDLAALSAQIAKTSGDLALANAAVETGKTALTAAQTENIALKAQLAEVQAKLDTALKNDTAAALTEANTKLAAADKVVADVTAFLADQASKLLVANGKKDEAVAKDAVALIEQIKGSQAALLSLIPVGGRSTAADAGADTAQKNASFSAYKVKA